MLAQNWATKLKKSGQNCPFGALAAEMEAQYIPVSTYNIPYSRQLMDGGHLACWDSIWVVWDVWRTQGPPKGIFCPKRCPFGGPSSAVEVFEEAGAHDMDTAQPDGSASGSWAQIRPLGAAKGPPGPPKGCFWAKTDPFGGPRSSVEVSEGAQAHGMDAAHPAGPTSGSWAKNRPTGPSEDL